ncbi:MAG: glycosyltransferase family 39 protein, partial [Gemmatimonadaceae bacterium]
MSSTAARRGHPAAWLLLLVAGQASAISLLQAGPGVAYPHYQFSRLLSAPYIMATAVLLLQAAAVLWGLRGAWTEGYRWLRQHAGAPALLMGAALLAVLSAAASRDPRYFAAELLLAFAVQLSALATVLLLARSLDDEACRRTGRRLLRVLGGEGEGATAIAPDRWAWPLAMLVVVVCAFLAIVVYEGVPHVPDEIVYLLQARYFAAGLVQLPAPPVPAAFDIDLMYYDADRYFSPVPPGWPAILSLGVRLGVPLLVNPLLSGVSVLLLYALLRRLGTQRAARLGTLLLASSPWFLFLGMSLMTHAATLACTLAAALGIAEARQRRAAWPAALAGLAVGMVGLIRPLEGLAVALVLGVWSLTASSPIFRLLPSMALTAVTVAVSALIRPYNAALTGSAQQFPIMMYVNKYYAPGANDLGFGPDRGMGWGGLDPWPGHGLRDVVLNSMLNGAALNMELFAWACGSLVFVVALIVT